MPDIANALKRYGTEEPPDVCRSVTAGPLRLSIHGGKLRYVRWHDVELVRGIDFPIRDPNWTTVRLNTLEERVNQGRDSWTYTRKFATADGRMEGEVFAAGRSHGELFVSVNYTAIADFETARTGFTVLHPGEGFAGQSIRIIHSDDQAEDVEIPTLISPCQPVYDIAGMAYTINDAHIDVAFRHEVFEMEDQRNWTDASFKTYCRPLSRPSPYRIPAGTTVAQEIIARFSGIGLQGVTAENDDSAQADVAEKLPEMTLAVDGEYTPTAAEISLLQTLGVTRLSVRLRDALVCGDIAELIKTLGVPFDLEILVKNDASAARVQLSEIADRLGSMKLEPDHVLGVPVDYLKSYQPDGFWPAGLSPQEAVGLVRAAFPNSNVGSGSLTNFTEFNRCRPLPADCDFVSHSTAAIFHAADDQSVFETLDAHPAIHASVRTIAPDVAYRLGLVSIGMRTNPYGQAPTANPAQKRTEAAQADPRQRGLFAAAWMVGAVAATRGARIESMALAMPSGPLGLMHRDEPWPQSPFDDGDRPVYPVFHVFKAFSRMAGLDRMSVPLPNGAHGVACLGAHGPITVIANGTPEALTVALNAPNTVILLDDDSFDLATSDPSWLEKVDRIDAETISIGPYGVAFVGLPELTGGLVE